MNCTIRDCVRDTKWLLIDAKGQMLQRLCGQHKTAIKLRPHVDHLRLIPYVFKKKR